MRWNAKWIAVLFLGMSLHINAQFSIGARVGYSTSSADFNGNLSMVNGISQSIVSSHFGIVGSYQVSPTLSLHSGINFVKKGFTVNESSTFDVLGMDIPLGIQAETSISYMEIPLTLQYTKSIGNDWGIFVEGGPSIAWASSGRISPVANFLIDINLPIIDLDLSNDLYSRTDILGNIGLGVKRDMTRGSISADIRYTKAFDSVLSDQIIDLDVKNSTLSFSIGYSYKI